MEAEKRLAVVQRDLKVSKSHFNSFGKYYYRSCEDILEAVKTLLIDSDVFYLSDDVVAIGDRYYIKATATFNGISATGWARESITKKGMDDSQITGSTSSYARKYALNGLFAIDDTKDADTNEARNQADNSPKVTKAPKVEVSAEDKLKAATAFVDDYLKQLVDVKTKDELMALQTKNSAGLDSIRNKYQNLNEHIIKKTEELKLES